MVKNQIKASNKSKANSTGYSLFNISIDRITMNTPTVKDDAKDNNKYY